jgi:hypothetical protein
MFICFILLNRWIISIMFIFIYLFICSIYSWIDEFEWIDDFHNVYLLHLYVFSTLGQQWLACTPCSWRGMPETTTGGFLLPWDAPLLLSRARRWEAPTATAPLLLPCICRRWEPPATTTLLLLHPPTQMTRWRCRWWLLLWHVSGCTPTSKRWAHIEHLF